MANVQTQIRIDEQVKNDVTILFKSLGLDMSSAVNIFLRQCIINKGLPFEVSNPNYNTETTEAFAEAKRISSDSSIPGYKDMDALIKALDS